VNEPARYFAVAATFAQKDPESIEPLVKLILDEESVRIRTKVAEGFRTNGWAIPEDERDAVRKVLPYEFGIDGEGKITKRA
jgi:hypothetical protein